LDTSLFIDTIIEDECSIVKWSDCIEEIRNLHSWESLTVFINLSISRFTTISETVSLEFDESEVLLLNFLQKLLGELERVRVVDIVVSASGGEFNTYFVSTIDANKSIKSFKAETNSVGDASTVLIGSLVSTVFQELINEISVSSVEFKSIETSFFSVFSTLSEFFNDFLDVFFSHLLRNWMRSLSVSMRSSNCNSTRSDRRLSTEEISESCTTTMPDLEDNFTTFFMHFLGDLLPSFNLLFAVDTTCSRETIRKRRNLTAFCEDCTETSSLSVILDH